MRTLLLILASAGALTATSAAAAPCSDDNVPGLWRLQSIKAAEPGVEAFYKANPHEYVSITPALSFSYVAGPRPLAPEAAERATAQAADLTGAQAAIFPEPGTLVVVRLPRQPVQAFACEIAGAPGRDVAVGDMVWTQLPNMPQLRRVHRKVKEAPGAPYRVLLMNDQGLSLIDTGSIRRTGDTATYAQVFVSPQARRDDRGQPIHHTRFAVEVRCSSREFRRLNEQSYTTETQLLADASRPRPWEKAQGELLDAVGIVCDGGAAPSKLRLATITEAARVYRAMHGPRAGGR